MTYCPRNQDSARTTRLSIWANHASFRDKICSLNILSSFRDSREASPPVFPAGASPLDPIGAPPLDPLPARRQKIFFKRNSLSLSLGKGNILFCIRNKECKFQKHIQLLINWNFGSWFYLHIYFLQRFVFENCQWKYRSKFHEYFKYRIKFLKMRDLLRTKWYDNIITDSINSIFHDDLTVKVN